MEQIENSDKYFEPKLPPKSAPAEAWQKSLDVNKIYYLFLKF